MPPRYPVGAQLCTGGVEYRVWAPEAKEAAVVIEKRGTFPMARKRGYLSIRVAGSEPGDRYRYRVGDRGPFPDPASRFQPEGVHGPSEVVDPAAYLWTDRDWTTPALRDLVFYELHVGTFSPEGTFEGVRKRLGYLRDLGVTAIELMPLADFAGDRNWGYDGVALFAPAHCYGTPEELRRLVNEAHGMGLAMLLDVVYNHFGPDGAYAGAISRRYFLRRNSTAWGAGMNLDGRYSAGVRRFFIQNAIAWLSEYHFDGLRLDATHALLDRSRRHLLSELTSEVSHAMVAAGRQAHLVAEDHRNLALLGKPASSGGYGLAGVWADDFHHQLRRHLAGDSDGYFADHSGSAADIATTLRQGWFYTGQHSGHFGKPRGSDPSPLAPAQFVICIQNHDQIGNRALGDRLHHSIDRAAYRAATTLLLLAPETPLLFMGQEWAASSPFQYFTDHHSELGKRVTEGRRREFQHFRAFSDPARRQLIPDPQANTAFEASRLRWEEKDSGPFASVLRLYRRLLRMRREQAAFRPRSRDGFAVWALDEHTVALRFGVASDHLHLVVVRLSGAGVVSYGPLISPASEKRWKRELSTEEPAYADDPQPIEIAEDRPVVEFFRPGALVFSGESY